MDSRLSWLLADMTPVTRSVSRIAVGKGDESIQDCRRNDAHDDHNRTNDVFGFIKLLQF